MITGLVIKQVSSVDVGSVPERSDSAVAAATPATGEGREGRARETEVTRARLQTGRGQMSRVFAIKDSAICVIVQHADVEFVRRGRVTASGCVV